MGVTHKPHRLTTAVMNPVFQHMRLPVARQVLQVQVEGHSHLVVKPYNWDIQINSSSQVDPPGSQMNVHGVPETQSNGNGHKLLAGGPQPGAAVGLAGDPGTSQKNFTGAGDLSHVSQSTDHMGTGDHTAESSFLLVTTDAAVVSGMLSQTEPFSVDHTGTGHQKTGQETHHGADPHGISQHGSAGGVDQLIGPQTDAAVAPAGGKVDPQSAFSHTDLAGMSGEPVTSSHTQLDSTVPERIYSSSPPDTLGLGEAAVTSGPTNVTETIMAAGLDSVPAGEQYITSGQGPEGAENMELEDTC
ncbi:uncharacterized protein LOC108921988 [Arapaima gigas]